MDIGHIRKDFTQHAPLEREALCESPFEQFEQWLQAAMSAEIAEPNAFSLATVSASGQPSQRTVLLKFFDAQGFVFYTNYQSRKAQEMAENQRVSLLFPWYSLQRQVKIEGMVEKVSQMQSLHYFLSRPVESQIGAWCSAQSRVIESRDVLMQQFAKLKEKFKNREVPLPEFWGGYRVNPTVFEFWQGQSNRLHDRFLYTKTEIGWAISRLAP